ncbi:MAG: hypothetical protein ACOY3I_08430 [Verrucomicrobiota bacterium]
MKTTIPVVASLFIMIAGLCAQDIPLIDLTGARVTSNTTSARSAVTQQTYANSYASQSAVRPQSALIQKEQVLASYSEREETGDTRRLRLYLRELAILQQAAKKAGGQIRVSIEPVGITSEELATQLASMNWFDIRPTNDAIVVRSKTDDPYLLRLREETSQLEEKRQSLMSDIQTLQRMANEWKEKIREQQTPSQEPASSAIAQTRPQQQRASITLDQNNTIIVPSVVTTPREPINVPATRLPAQSSTSPTSTMYASPANGRLSPLAVQSKPSTEPEISLRTSEPAESTVILAPRGQW